MTKKTKQTKKATKSSKRTKVAAKPEDETDTAAISGVGEAPQATPTFPETEVPVEPQQATEVAAPATLGTESETAPKTTRSETAKTNIKEGLKQHAIAGRPTKAQLVLVFGQKGYLMTWAQRTAKFGITPEAFQAALAKGTPAVPLTPIGTAGVGKAKEKA